jgi:hypothetical protein
MCAILMASGYVLMMHLSLPSQRVRFCMTRLTFSFTNKFRRRWRIFVINSLCKNKKSSAFRYLMGSYCLRIIRHFDGGQKMLIPKANGNNSCCSDFSTFQLYIVNATDVISYGNHKIIWNSLLFNLENDSYYECL